MALTKVSTGMIETGTASVDLDIDSGTLYIDVTNGRVGVSNSSPATALDITGTTTATLFSGSGASLTNIPNVALDNSSITINSYLTSLGGSVTLSTSDVGEGTNLYYTDARWDTKFAAASTTGLSEGTNLYYTDARWDTKFAAASTTGLSEGTNLYYTDARADARVSLIVDAAPATLNTLNELAAALGDDANFSTTVTNSIAAKLPLAGGALTGPVTTNSTFDGRNVSVDGAKLDGIAVNANNYVFPYSITQAATGLAVVRRESTGNIYATSFNGTDTFSTTGNTTGMGLFTGTNGSDTFGRSYTAAAARSLLNVADGANNYVFPYTIDTAASNNTVVRRQASGYIYATFFNGTGTFSTTGVTSGMSFFTGTNGNDTFGRSYTPAAARAALNVENGATADQTAAEILTAIKTVDGTGSGLDADTLDGQQGSYYAPIASPSFTTQITTPQIRNNSAISFLTAAGGAVGVKVNSLYAGTSYGPNNAPSGMVNALSGYQVANSTVINSSGDWTGGAISDERLKENIQPITNALEKLNLIRGVEFDWNDKQDSYEGHDLGVIAQDVEAVVPELVQTKENGFKTVKYEKLTALLIEAVKELQKEVEVLKNNS